ncbi:cell migration inducing hyaluronidase 2 [Homo sapiens]|uniref:Isoform 2 of Cell surface hyaluronidase CEMIP2 n=1 Tax=Homo sapiens TaxID=9606 RepID=Q9UHN6-2|nr:inactive cell surface hyaluronidase CEMIP2 isoform b [Homo sapiens]XP_047279092.1 inactive cell surface hyaluronidase CEMIP2 isoform X2 [Homo sapiens]XP_054218564.1 inactive cell surface hyaluronidase CEMIP2 isoform X2 [Homo sapiens]AAI40774.1 TMEM2 protein [Homo sapiens]KAI2552846.1 cell migration inducing hyaluronidase 2 [Homo sapiens]KAI4007375.1 cell migration inducing hyaluronidase 2 [Homo sapiens]|eukprot:NP_001129292.1 cell surface hyaluronidase isoform b [Homo sapiens]
MYATDSRGHSPAFLQPQNGNSRHPSGYVPGKVVPLRPPPPPKSQASAKFTSIRREDRATFAFSPEEQQAQRESQKQKRHKNTFICFAITSFSFFIALAIILGISSKYAPDENCPDQNPRLRNWDPGQDSAKQVVIKEGDMLRLTSDATVHSIVIQDGGLLVFGDNKDGSRNITLRTHYILIQDGGALHIGAEKCRYKSKATITLYGKSDEGESMPTFGKKFIGVEAGGTLELHGARKASWTLLARTLNSSGLPFGSYTFEKDFSRGLNVRVIDQDTAKILESERFDTHEYRNESRRLQEFLRFQDPGRIVAIAVGDSAAKSLLQGTIQMIQERLGSELIQGLGYRQAWALVGVIDGGSTSCNESVRNYENHSSGGKALAQREFYTVDGQKFSVTAYSEWIEETPQFLHMGEIIDGVDMRAEVGILTRNIVIQGEVEDSCYAENQCQFFDYDTFGGHIMIMKNFTSVHLSYVELKHMGQQQMGRYPVHFHLCGDVDYKGGYRHATFVDGLSIHHSFSRCITVHGTNGLLIKDTIGFDTLGHCFFLEDGIEQRNTLFHNLGLLTKPGTLLPTDRNNSMCTTMRDKVFGNYIPVPATDCMAVSTFWIAHPNNNLINNAAAGSQDAGIWYLFHKEPTGESSGLQLLAKPELTPLGIFYNNRVHSNFKAGLFIDKGVKTTNSSAADPREYLCLDNSARFRPHQDANPEKPRVAALIDRLIAFKNNDNGAWVRGGDIIVQNSAFADNGIGLTFASDGSFPSDEGSSQEVSESLFVGESRNYGFQGGQNKYVGTGGIDQKPRTLPRNRTFPIRGFQIYDGPIHLTRSTFKKYVPTPDRYSSAIGFLMKNSWQITPRNNISLVKFGPHVSLNVFFGKPGPWFEDCEMDGDKNSIFHDIDGSVTGYKDAYVGRMDNYLIRHPSCVNVSKWNAVICSGTYAQVYVQTWSTQNLSMTITRDEYPSNPMVLRGINQKAAFPQYQPVVMLEKGYTIHWNGPAPRTTFLYLVNFNKNDWIRVGLCYPSNTSFQVTFGYLQRQNGSLSKIEEYEPVHSLEELQRKQSERKFYFDSSTGLLFLYLKAKSHRHGHSYCSSQGCERVKIQAATDSKDISNCMAKAYPQYYRKPSVVKRMPAMLTGLCQGCGTRQVVFTSDPHKSYLPVQFQSPDKAETQRGDPSVISVNGTDFTFRSAGVLLLVVDPCSVPFRLTEKTVFPLADVSRIEEYLKTGIPPRSIVLLSTRGEIKQLNISHLLVPLGLAKPAHLYDKGSTIFLGFSGNFKPSWTKLFTSPAGQGLGVLEQFIPLQLDEYGCPRATTVRRRDLELLKQASKAH